MGMVDNHKQDQKIDINIEGNISGDIKIDRHDIDINQSVSDVTVGEDAIIATGEAKITVKRISVAVIPSWVWIVIFVFIVGGIVGFWTYRMIIRHSYVEQLRFKQGEIGILVARFKDVGDTGNSFAEKIAVGLRKYRTEIDNKNIVVKQIPLEVKPYFESEEEVKKMGNKLGAKLVIWGSVGMRGMEIYPTVQPIIEGQSRYDLTSIGEYKISSSIAELDVIEFENAATIVEDDIKRLISFILGCIHYRQLNIGDKENYDNCIKHFQEAVGFTINSSNNAYPHYYLGNIYYYSKNIQKAKQEYEKAKESKSNFVEAFNNLGVIALNPMYDLKEALKNFHHAEKCGTCSKQADELTGNSSKNLVCVRILNNLAITYLENGEYKKATETAEDAIKIFKVFQNDFPQSVLTKLYNNAAYIYIEWAKQEPKSDCIKKAEVFLMRVKNMLEKESSENLKSGWSAFFRNKGRICLGLKEWVHALEYFEKAKELDPEYPGIYLLLAQLYSQRCWQGDEDRKWESVALYYNRMKFDGRLKEADIKMNKLQQSIPQTQ